MDAPWRKAIIGILQASHSAMHYTEIAEAIITKKLRSKVGATPAATVLAIITSDVKKNGDSSVFRRVKPGEYILRAAASTPTQGPPLTQGGDEEEPKLRIIQAVGMFWRRDWVHWDNATKLLGQQQQGASHVDFYVQIGVYLLHDGREVIYVGRTTDGVLGGRLFAHTRDRLNGRWDRFSWFGLLRVTDEGALIEPEWSNLQSKHLIATMEALLIEGLEPRQNRKRGEDLTEVEYLQVKDPRIEKQEQTAVLEKLKERI
ncbi:MAG: HTH domain-containing protein [Chloroflexota bacterium]|nr:HTH domain-containing protein [Chloroflexota bacterium]